MYLNNMYDYLNNIQNNLNDNELLFKLIDSFHEQGFDEGFE